MRTYGLLMVSVGLVALGALGCGSSGGSGDKSGKDGGAQDASTSMSNAGHGGGIDGGGGGAGAGSDGGMMSMNNDAGMAMGKVHGRVFSALDLSPIKAAKIAAAGGGSITTDAKGVFTLDVIAKSDAMLSTTASGFARGITRVTVLANGESYVEITLAKVSATAKLDAAKGGTLSGASGESATFPAGAFVTSAGAKVSGQVEVSLAPINPSDKLQMRAFPGTFSATTKAGKAGLLETFVPMDISATNAAGEALTIAAGKTANVTFPVYDTANAPQTIALWSLDPATGIWREEGTAVRTLDAAGMPVYQATIGHMSWWNCDAFRNQLTCVRGCVEMNGTAAAGVAILAEGIDYHVGGGGYTDFKGCFAQDVKIGGQIAFRAVYLDNASDVKTITAGNVAATAETSPAKCQDLGTFTLKPVPKVDSACPSGFTSCGGTCVDLASDLRHCGTCTLGCSGGEASGGGVAGASCIAGKCTCKATQNICSNTCADFMTDRSHCGDCTTVCNTGDECSAGKCKPIVCGSSLSLCGNDCVDTSTSLAHCGACANACNAEATGSSGYVCTAGQCVCHAGSTECNQSCVDETSDRNNCGACGNACATGKECKAGSCQDIVCPQSQTLCGNACVDLSTDNNHCGACGTVCPGEGGISCMAGVCKCPAGKTQCAQGCMDASSDRFNCGGCGIVCRSGFACTASSCVAKQCAQNETLCGDTCVNTNTDSTACGACGNHCDAGLSCVSGTCGCPGGKVACPNAPTELSPGYFTCAASCPAAPSSCANVAGDYDITGDAICSSQLCTLTQVGCVVKSTCCDKPGTVDTQGVISLSCSTGAATCTFAVSGGSLSGGCSTQAGQCSVSGTSPACSAGEQLCSGTCIDTQTNAYNCGACGNVCQPDQTCVSGACVNVPCNSGNLFCGSGCTDQTSDAYNCGGCNIVCSNPTPNCVNSVCAQ